MSDTKEDTVVEAALVEEDVDLGSIEQGEIGADRSDDDRTESTEDEPAVARPRRSARVRAFIGALRIPMGARRYVVAGLAVLAVASAGALGFLWGQAGAAQADNDGGGEALATVRAAVPQLLSYDYNTIDRTFPTASATRLVGDFKDDYTELGKQVIIPAAKKDKIVTKATVVDGSVVESGADDATLLLFVNQQTTAADQQGPRLDGSRIRVEARRVDGNWLISALTPV